MKIHLHGRIGIGAFHLLKKFEPAAGVGSVCPAQFNRGILVFTDGKRRGSDFSGRIGDIKISPLLSTLFSEIAVLRDPFPNE